MIFRKNEALHCKTCRHCRRIYFFPGPPAIEVTPAPATVPSNVIAHCCVGLGARVMVAVVKGGPSGKAGARERGDRGVNISDHSLPLITVLDKSLKEKLTRRAVIGGLFCLGEDGEFGRLVVHCPRCSVHKDQRESITVRANHKDGRLVALSLSYQCFKRCDYHVPCWDPIQLDAQLPSNLTLLRSRLKPF